MLFLEVSQIVDVFIYNDPQVTRRLVRRDVSRGEALRHVAPNVNTQGEENAGVKRAG
jgi:hypothetical protein